MNKKLLKKLTINESLKFLKIAKNFKAEIQNNLSINFDKNYKIKNYNYLSDGKIIELDLNFLNPINDLLSGKDVKDIYFKNNQLKTKLNSETKEIDIQGEYSFDDIEYLKFNLKNKSGKENYNLVIDFDYSNEIYFELINYRKTKEKKANLSANIEKKGNELKIKKISYVENDNKISIDNLILNNNFLKSFDNISVKTIKNNKLNNEFEINTKKKIYVKGTQFDATNLPKVLSNQKDKKFLYNLNKEIEIDLSNIIAPLSENLKNFKLLGYVDKGKFSKISSKGDFGNNNFLDISMQNDSKKGVKYLEVYSDLPKPLLTEYSFFKGLSDGKLIYSSIIDKNEAKSKLTIENFKLINAPGAIKLLSLADLGGLADLVSGEGLSFNILEIKMTNTSGHLKLEEIFATGPSISVLMEGYQDKNGLTSLRGTLVPAKTLNKMISKIPVIGDIVIPKEVGEGLFGISFKMKGPKGKVKTTINPIRTLTPRFIQKIVDRKKSSK